MIFLGRIMTQEMDLYGVHDSSSFLLVSILDCYGLSAKYGESQERPLDKNGCLTFSMSYFATAWLECNIYTCRIWN